MSEYSVQSIWAASLPEIDEDTEKTHGPVRFSREARTPEQLRSHKVEWFYEAPGDLSPSFRELLVNYSHVPAAQVDRHLIDVRNEAWKVNPMPCLGRFLFTELHLSMRSECYDEIVKRLQKGARLLDVGCCLGQDVRKLIHDGAPSDSLAGIDLDKRFFELGNILFRDEGSKVEFIEANILQKSPKLDALRHSFDILHMCMFLHMLTWEEQLALFKKANELLKPVEGSMVVGESAGHVHGIATESTWNKSTFRHNESSFRTLMALVSEETGTEWNVKAELIPGSGRTNWLNQNNRRFLFEIRRR